MYVISENYCKYLPCFCQGFDRLNESIYFAVILTLLDPSVLKLFSPGGQILPSSIKAHITMQVP